MKKSMVFSKLAEEIEGKPTFRAFKKAEELEKKGKRVIHFEIGDPEFDTPLHIIEAARSSLKKGETHYADSMGLYELRKAIQKHIHLSRKFKPDINQILVTPGANIILYLAISCLVDPGKEVIVPDPGFPTFQSIIKLCGAKAVPVPLQEEKNFRMDAEDLKKVISKKTRMIIINSPSNPTGALMTQKELDEIYRVAKKHNIYIVSDEIYSKIIYGKNTFYSASTNDRCMNSTILMTGFSKTFAMTGWRLGFAVGPEKIIEKMGLLGETLYSCVPPFIQRAGIAALHGSQTQVSEMMALDEKKRNLIIEGLNDIEGISCDKTDGAFYVFANIKKTGMSSRKFTDFLIEKAGVLVLPGTDFGKYGEGYVRFAFATNIDNIREGLLRIKRVLKK